MTRTAVVGIALLLAFVPTAAMAEGEGPDDTFPASAASMGLEGCAADADDREVAALLAEFPPSLQGEVLEANACHGRDWLELQASSDASAATTLQRAELLVGSQGKTLDDLIIAAALHEPVPGQVTVIVALRLRGASADRLIDTAIPLLLGIERPVKAERTAGDTEIWVTLVRDAALPGTYPTTLYAPLGETLWAITADRPELLAEIVAALPGPGGRLEVPALGVAITFPDDWQVRSRPERMGNPDFDLDAIQWSVAGGSPPGGGACSLMLARPTDVTPLEAMAQMLSDSDEEPLEPEVLEGGMVRLAGSGSFLGGDTDMGIYLKGSDDALALMWCMAEEAPADLWLPLAESIELMPPDDTVLVPTPDEPTAEPTILEQ